MEGFYVYMDQCHWIKRDHVVLESCFVFKDDVNTLVSGMTLLLLLNQCRRQLFSTFFLKCASVYF